MSQEALVDYNRRYKEEVASLKDKKPTLFLHACCGPCLTYPLSILVEHFKVIVGYFNPNIYPESEYFKRRDAMMEFIEGFSKDKDMEIPVVLNPNEDFIKYQTLFKDRVNDKEGGNTCLKCHAYRMNLAYEYAYLHHFDYFTTVMTVSCKKPSRELNEIAMTLEKKYPETKYLYSDFKKEDGQLKGIRIAKNYNVYRQNYCGCKPSLEERIRYLEQKKKESIIG